MESAMRKRRGAYYTAPGIASFLTNWAIRSPSDSVLEPCFGGGVFLSAAVERIRDLGGLSSRVVGIEADEKAFAAAKGLADSAGLGPTEVIRANFFSLTPRKTGRFSAVVGNPPFVRYQRFAGPVRARALSRAAEAGISLSALASAWAPFLVHAATFLECAGRLAMVAPAELCHAGYARPVLQFLRTNFRQVRILTFERRLFEALNEDTVLILADSYGENGNDLRLVSLSDESALQDQLLNSLQGSPVGEGSGQAEGDRLITYLLPEETRDLYKRLAGTVHSYRLGSVASVGIGYVTGSNKFFHLTADEVKARGIPKSVLKRAVCRGAWLCGLMFTMADWGTRDTSGHRTRLLHLTGRRQFGPSVTRYLRFGQRHEVHRAYKCRVRRPWYAVPNVAVPALFLTYMANDRPFLALNRANAVAPNTLLCVDIRRQVDILPEALAASWWTSLSALSCEIEGHSLGGGLLKLEPGEANRVILPLPPIFRDARAVRGFVVELDSLVRSGDWTEALDLGDRTILQDGLGLSKDDCRLLREATEQLSRRRRQR